MAAPRSAENNPLATKAGTDIADGLVELIAEHVEQLAARVGPEKTDVGDLAGVARVAIYQSLLDALPARIQQLARSSVDDYSKPELALACPAVARWRNSPRCPV